MLPTTGQDGSRRGNLFLPLAWGGKQGERRDSPIEDMPPVAGTHRQSARAASPAAILRAGRARPQWIAPGADSNPARLGERRLR
jgi:hypothetical protein